MLMRWMSPDPMAIHAGVGDPYAYVGGKTAAPAGLNARKQRFPSMREPDAVRFSGWDPEVRSRSQAPSDRTDARVTDVLAKCSIK